MIGLTSMLISAARHRNAVPPPPAYYPYLKTQIGEEAPVNQGTDPEGLTTLPLPSVDADTNVIAETPVSADTINLSTLALPSVSADTGLAYQLTYNGNGNDGGAAPADTTWYAHGTDATVSGAGTLTLTAHSFDGWNTVDDGSGTAYAAAASITMTAPTTLYAQWAAD